MIQFILKRLLFYIISVPALILIILYLVNSSVVDPVEELMNLGEYIPSKEEYKALYAQTAEKHHLDIPLFYVSIKSGNYSKDFFTIKEKKYRKLAEYFLENGARFSDVDSFLKEVKQVELVMDNKDLVQQSTFNTIFLKNEYNKIESHLNEVSDAGHLAESLRILEENSVFAIRSFQTLSFMEPKINSINIYLNYLEEISGDHISIINPLGKNYLERFNTL